MTKSIQSRGFTAGPLIPCALVAWLCLGVGPCDPRPIGTVGDAAVDGPAGERADASSRPEMGTPPGTPPGTLPGVPADAGPNPPPTGVVPGPCAELASEDACGAKANCRWLSPGCGNQMIALPRAGCFDVAHIDCTSDAVCPAGQRCQPRNIDPCGPARPGQATCAACGVDKRICS